MTNPGLLVPNTPCTIAQIEDRTCDTLSAWAAVDAAKDAAKAANATVDLGFAGLFVGALTLLAAFYAAWQTKRGADAAVQDARANADASKTLAQDRALQLNAQARLHGAKIRLSGPVLKFNSANSAHMRWNISNVGELAAQIINVEVGLQCAMNSQVDWILDRKSYEIENSTTILPLQDRQLDLNFDLHFENESMANATSWFETKFYVWITWTDAFEMRRFEKWEAIGTNIVGTIEQHGAFNLLWEEASPE